MCCRIQHDVLTSDLHAFLNGTFHVGVQKVEHGEPPLLLGNCPDCASTLAIPIAEVRGTVVHGEMGAVPVYIAPERTSGIAFPERADPTEDDDRICTAGSTGRRT